jgi:hypothetical protein
MLTLFGIMINIIVTSKPIDGLFYYSYEYCSLLNQYSFPCQIIVICHRNFNKEDYLQAIRQKYIHCENIIFDNFIPQKDSISLVLGRSLVTLAWQDFEKYNDVQKTTLRNVFAQKLIAVYSENHPTKYLTAIDFFKPKKIVDVCDTDVYPNGIGNHFEKRINFSIYKSCVNKKKFKYLFLGTNKEYYTAADEVIHNFLDHGILTYNTDYINSNNNNIIVPVGNLLGIFDAYVYTKKTFDPAPRIIQECKFYDKEIIYLRDKNIIDGGYVYFRREIEDPDITAIVNALEKLL